MVFEVDHHDDLFRWGWSVAVSGSIHRVTDQTVLDRLEGVHRPKAWAGGDRPVVLSVVPDEITGRRVRLRE